MDKLLRCDCINDIEKNIIKYDKIIVLDIEDKRYFDCFENADMDNCAFVEMNEAMRDLYYTYDFSDKVVVIHKDSKYPLLFNYLEHGIISEEELVSVLLK